MRQGSEIKIPALIEVAVEPTDDTPQEEQGASRDWVVVSHNGEPDAVFVSNVKARGPVEAIVRMWARHAMPEVIFLASFCLASDVDAESIFDLVEQLGSGNGPDPKNDRGKETPERVTPKLPRPVGFNDRAFSYYPRLQRVEDYVEQHLSKRISLADAAREAAFEATHFSKFFHGKTGICFREWLLWKRVEKATALLNRHDLTIFAVARRVGFCDLRTFQRAFKKFTKMTPSDWKKLLQPGGHHPL